MSDMLHCAFRLDLDRCVGAICDDWHDDLDDAQRQREALALLDEDLETKKGEYSDVEPIDAE